MTKESIQQPLQLKRNTTPNQNATRRHTHVTSCIQAHGHLCWLEVQRPVCFIY